jgi:predicted RNA-binding protein with TRAM domain
MSVYVDDILIAAESETVKSAIEAIKEKWAISEVEWAAEKRLRYCGF